MNQITQLFLEGESPTLRHDTFYLHASSLSWDKKASWIKILRRKTPITK